MSVTALEALMNAQINFQTFEKMNPAVKSHPSYSIAKNQLDNVIEHLEADKGINDILEVEGIF